MRFAFAVVVVLFLFGCTSESKPVQPTIEECEMDKGCCYQLRDCTKRFFGRVT